MEAIKELVLRMKAASSASIAIAVIGDVSIDRYYFIDNTKSELSVETGQAVDSVKRVQEDGGGAANVAVNLKRLGCETVDLYGVVGNDFSAMVLRSILFKEGIGDMLITQRRSWVTNVYHKIVEKGVEKQRFDLGNYNKIQESTLEALLNLLRNNKEKYDAFIINEQLMTGIHSPSFIKALQGIIDVTGERLWFVDTRHYCGCYNGVIYKLNLSEASALTHAQDAFSALTSLGMLGFQPAVITCGEEGAVCLSQGKMHVSYGIDHNQAIDTVGAGDAFLAGLAFASALGFNFYDATDFANLAASVSVLTLSGTGHPSIKDILRACVDISWRYNGLKAKTGYGRKYLAGGVEVIEDGESFPVGLPKVAVFDHDGTISVLRQGWEEVMFKSLLSYLPCNKREEAADSLRELIDRTTGVQTITQMKLFCELALEKNWLDRQSLRTPGEYKEAYLRSLKETMLGKLEAFRNGFLDTSDLTVKGSVSFLHKLKDAGTVLYLASGTDVEDVRAEAQLLGYAELFDGRIYGSVGNVEKDPKKIVMEHIANDIAASGFESSECIVFGDGPVEMREARKNGFLPVGILSDERRRYGANEAKRPRLIRGGAKILVPDFSVIDEAVRQRDGAV